MEVKAYACIHSPISVTVILSSLESALPQVCTKDQVRIDLTSLHWLLNAVMNVQIYVERSHLRRSEVIIEGSHSRPAGVNPELGADKETGFAKICPEASTYPERRLRFHGLREKSQKEER